MVVVDHDDDHDDAFDVGVVFGWLFVVYCCFLCTLRPEVRSLDSLFGGIPSNPLHRNSKRLQGNLD